MKRVITNIQFTSDEEYFLYEEKSELRHELINGNLYEMSSISILHNNIVLQFILVLNQLLNKDNYAITFESFKVRTPDGNYFYPDVMVCEKSTKKYFAENPVLIVEVLSESTRKFDLVDKFIQYQKLDSLQYYLCVEPEQQMIMFYYKAEDGEWMTDVYTGDNDTIELKQLQLSFVLKDIYKLA